MSQGWPRESSFSNWKTASGEDQRANISPQPQYCAMSLKILKSESAWPGARRHFLDQADAALGIDEGAFLFAPARGGQDEVRALRRLRGVIHVLHDEEIELLRAAR